MAAALCTGNYGLSQNCTDDSKEYFFVKLTDSAYRAVEEYQRNQNKYSTHATIQIIGTEGILSFPTVGGNVGQQFSFSIDEIEGSFECIRQTQNQLDVLGALPYKMRIHANDDVYETTRYRMAVAEENQKNKCTREIKPNQTDIGRKVKLKNSSNRLTNIPSKRDHILTNASQSSLIASNSLSSGSIAAISPISNNNNTNNNGTGLSSLSGLTSGTNSTSLPPSTSSNSNSNIKNSSNLSTNSLSYSNNSSKLHSNYNNTTNSLSTGMSAASSLSSVLSSAAGSGTSGINSGYFNNSSGGLRTTSGLSMGNNPLNGTGSRRGVSGINNSNRNQKNGSRHMPDITKRKIRERLIHLLALKPFKKPELYTRLQNEGIREREKSLITGILKEISTMRDNTYNLKRQIWNDVNEDWPFYTEQELQMLKRRKPQNLTPPLSSDGGSSTSGQSPTSTHNGSPPPAVKRPSLDRDRFYEEPISKKQRISHFRKDTNEFNSSAVASNKHHHETDDSVMVLSYSVLGNEAARRISPRDDSMDSHNNNNNNNNSHQQNIITNHHHNINNNNNFNNNNSNSNKISNLINSRGNTCQQSPSNYNLQNNSNKLNVNQDNRRQCSSPLTTDNPNSGISSTPPGAGSQHYSPVIEVNEQETAINNNSRRISQNSSNNSNSNNNLVGGPLTNYKYDFSQFTKITSIEQRRQYKTEFENDFDEYRELLNKIESVGKRFKVLAQRLNNARNNDTNYRVIKREIVAEYEKINREQEHQRTKARFDYLHAKLAHIKALVSEFDKTLTSSSSSTPTTTTITQSNASNNENMEINNYNGNRNRTSPILPSIGSSGTSVNIINGSNSSNINTLNSTRTSPNNHNLGPNTYSTTSGTSNLHHLPKQENY